VTQRRDKAAVRVRVLVARRKLPADRRMVIDADLVERAVALAAGRTRIAAYAPMAGEPGGPALVSALAGAVASLLLPVVRPDLDLDWAVFDGSWGPSVRPSLAEPAGPRLGPGAITGAELIFVPAVSVDAAGVRLGRGGGSYDRALARVGVGTPVVALLYDGEVEPVLPAEPHDRPVTAVLTPTGLWTVPFEGG
jgi:5-formyltetrahydrofolate cyclo-ligase